MAAAAAAASAAAVSSIASGATRVIASSSSSSAQITAAASASSSLATSAGSGLAHTIDMPFEWLGGTVMGGVPADYLKVRALKAAQLEGDEGRQGKGKKRGAEKKDARNGSLAEGWGENEERTRLRGHSPCADVCFPT